MRLFEKGLMAGVALAALTASGASAQEDQVEVLHWWTAGGEAEALDVLKQNLEEQGVTWSDMPVAGGAGDAAMTTLRARVTSGNAPTAVQMLGYDITEWAEAGVVASLDQVAEEENWAEFIPAALQEFSKHDGQWIAAPVNIHSTNWLWINKSALDEAGMEPPTDWDGLIAMLDAFEAQGITPLAHGGQAWQDATVWENVVLSMGPDFYKSAVLERDPEALASDEMQTVFERMETLRGYVDDNFSGRDWNLASAMVIEGEAGAQQMGDWAKGEFLRADMTPGEDFVCIRFPGTQDAVTFNADQFVMFQVGEEKRDAQLKMASAIEAPEFQIAFNTVKGSVPARTDVPVDEFDSCGQKSMQDVTEASEAGTLLGSLAHGYAAPPAIKNAMQDVITQHFNGAISTEEAPAALAEAVEFAQ